MSANSAAKNLTSGNLWKNIILFSLPLIASNLLQVLFNLSDMAIVGNFAENGSDAMGSVGSTTMTVNLFTGFLIGLGGGINVVVATAFGASDKEGVEKSVHSAAVVAPLVGIILALLGFFGARPLLELLDTKTDLIDGAELYLRIYFLGMPAVAVYNFGNGLYSAVGDTKKPLIFLSISGVLNIFLNMFFVIVCKMSVAGVALASIISQYLSAFLILLFLFRSKDIFCLRLKKLRFDPEKTKRILFLGIPAGLQNAIFSIANMFIQKAYNSFDTVTVDGIAAAQNADPIVYDVQAAFYMACSSFIGQAYGHKNKKIILKSYFISLLYSFTAGAILGLSLALFSHQFVSLFTADEAVIEAAKIRLGIMSYSYMVSAFMDAPIAASRGIGKTVVPTISVIMGSCVFRIIWVYTVFAYFKTLVSLFLLYVFSWTITAIAENIYFFIALKKVTANFASDPEELRTVASR